MKQTICVLCAVLILLSALSACGQKLPNIKEPNDATDSGYIENIFDTQPTESIQQNQDPTKATEGQENQNATNSTASQQGATAPTQNQESSATQPTQSQQTPATQPTQGQQTPATQPTQGQQTPSTQPAEEQETTSPTTDESVLDEETKKLAQEYKTYNNMSGTEKENFRKTFESNAAFFAWYNAAMEADKKVNPPIEIGPDGTIDLPPKN